jgi:hypothetical protein
VNLMIEQAEMGSQERDDSKGIGLYNIGVSIIPNLSSPDRNTDSYKALLYVVTSLHV